jgi:hypothetical protein
MMGEWFVVVRQRQQLQLHSMGEWFGAVRQRQQVRMQTMWVRLCVVGWVGSVLEADLQQWAVRQQERGTERRSSIRPKYIARWMMVAWKDDQRTHYTCSRVRLPLLALAFDWTFILKDSEGLTLIKFELEMMKMNWQKLLNQN